VTTLRAVAAAATFLTRVPFGIRMRIDGDDLVRGAVAFPVVGAVIGALVGGVAVVQVELGLPVMVAAIGAVAVEIVVTGALHIDGLADTADGLAGREPAHSLEIMRDHGIGVYGVCAVVLDLLLKVTVIVALPTSELVLTLAAVFAVSRSAPLPLAAALPYAGSEGTGRDFVERLGTRAAAAGVVLGGVLAIALGGLWALTVVGALVVVTLAVGVAAHRRLSGITGDVLGAAVELTTLAGLFTAIAWSA
jgi:adenosylcobinamide-GDP ribazoletransferase